MHRIPEPELMNEAEQAKAYAEADFSEPHDQFIEQFKQCINLDPDTLSGFVLDLGCGPADISIRFAKAFPNTVIHGLDGAEAMLALGQTAIDHANLSHRVELYQGLIQAVELPLDSYDVIISNSLLHHIHDPTDFWSAIKRFSNEKTLLFIMDLFRPDSEQELDRLVTEYAKGEPEVLQKDFRNSLHAAFTPEEIESQLAAAGLSLLNVRTVSDRHCLIY